MGDAALRLQGVTYRYGDRVALSDVSFSVAPGESVGYLGPNGAGKSTTLKLLAGLLRPSSGTVEILGGPADGPARAHLGALIETPRLPEYLHGADLLRYVADVRGIPAAAQREAIQRAASELGVSDRLDEPVGGLSTGLTRRLMIATALVGDPDVLILDEPTLGLDPAARHDLRRVLRSLHGAGRTLLLSTHLLDDAESVCDRVLFLREGRVVGDEPVSGAPAPPGTAPSRIVRFRFADPVELGRFAALLAPGESAQLESDRDVAVKLLGDDHRQTELIARIVGARLPLLSAGPALDGLTQRYLDAVGREEDP